MPIYAERAGNGTSLANIAVRAQKPIQDGGTLVYDSKLDAFVVRSHHGTLPAITGGETLNSGGIAHTVLAGKNGDLLSFKRIVAGSGIVVSSDDEQIIIRANVATDRLSVPGSYRITIDNDNNTYDKAVFEVWTTRSTVDIPIVAMLPNLFPIYSNAIYTGNEGGLGYFRAINDIDFISLGLRPGMWINVNGTVSQDGDWLINRVYNDVAVVDGVTQSRSTLELTVPFTGSFAHNLGGPQFNECAPSPGVLFQQGDLIVMPPDPAVKLPWDASHKYRIQSYALDFGPKGLDLRQGMVVQIRNTQAGLHGLPSNDGQYTIWKVIPKGSGPFDLSTLIFTADCPLPGPTGPQLEADPQKPMISLTIKDAEVPTGFQVSELGELKAVNGTFAEYVTSGPKTAGEMQPTQPNHLVRKDYVDRKFKPNRPLRYFLTGK